MVFMEDEEFGIESRAAAPARNRNRRADETSIHSLSDCFVVVVGIRIPSSIRGWMAWRCRTNDEGIYDANVPCSSE